MKMSNEKFTDLSNKDKEYLEKYELETLLKIEIIGFMKK